MGSAPVTGITGREIAPFGWAPLIILFLVGLVDRIETYIASGTLPLLQEEWGFSDTMGGMIMTAPLLMGALALIPAGYLADRYNRTSMIAIVVALWSFIMLGSALAPVFAFFFLTRILLGTADTIHNPASSSLLADYFGPKTRSKVFGWVRLTNYAGVALGTMLGAVVGGLFGWRWAFAVMVIPGLIVAWLCWRLREPVRGFLDEVIARDSGQPVQVPDSRALAQDVQRTRPPGLGKQFRYIWRILTLRLVCIGLALLSLALLGIFYWMTTLINRVYGVEVEVAGLINAAVILVGVCGGTVFGGWLGGRWHQTKRGGRLLAGGVGLFLGTVVLGAALYMDALGPFVLLLTLSCFLSAIAIPNLFAAIADVVQASSRGIGFALLNFLIIGGSALGPVIVGAISDANDGNLTLGMYALLPMMLASGLLVMWGRRYFDEEAKTLMEEVRSSSNGADGARAPRD